MRYLIMLAALLLGAGPAAAAMSVPGPSAAPARSSGDDVAQAGRGVSRIIAALDWPDGRNFVSTGSGFAVSPRHIVTNYHVVELFDRYAQGATVAVIAVVPSQGSQPFQARLVRANPAKDLALLEIVGGTMPPLTVFTGTPTSGQQLTALGYPGNVDAASARTFEDYVLPTPFTRSGGEFSSSRTINGIDAYLHDAQIARGNSGGPLVDRCGRVVGVNTFITGGQANDATFGFAVSSHELMIFLRGAEIQPTAQSDNCVTTAEREQMRLQQVNAAITQARSTCEADNQRSREEHARISAAAMERAEDREQTFLFIAVALLVLGGVAGAGALVMHGQGNKRGVMIAGAGGGLLLVAAAVVFIMRDQGLDSDPQPPTLQNCEAAATEAASGLSAENMADAIDAAVDANGPGVDDTVTNGM